MSFVCTLRSTKIDGFSPFLAHEVATPLCSLTLYIGVPIPAHWGLAFHRGNHNIFCIPPLVFSKRLGGQLENSPFIFFFLRRTNKEENNQTASAFMFSRWVWLLITTVLWVYLLAQTLLKLARSFVELTSNSDPACYGCMCSHFPFDLVHMFLQMPLYTPLFSEEISMACVQCN